MRRSLCMLLLSFLLAEAAFSSSSDCDNFVRKIGRRYRSIVRCAHGNLTRVPQRDLRSLSVAELLLDDNRLARLSDHSFHSWTDLVRLSVRNNRISRISVRAFRPLRKLRRLNLSGNRLHLPAGLSVHSLAYVPEIVELDLSFNPLRRIPPYHFQILGSLQILHLRGVARPDLSLETDAFAGLKELHTLDLTSNFLHTMSEAVLGDTSEKRRLSTLLLGGANPWQCDCRLRWLKRRQLRQLPVSLRRTDPARALAPALQAQCEEPLALHGRYLIADDDLRPDDFQCEPQLVQPSSAQPFLRTAYSGHNVSLVCTFNGDPVEGIEWFKDSRRATPASLGRLFVKSRSSGRNVEARIFLPNVRPADNGRWVCVGWNGRGKAAGEFILTVTPPCSEYARPLRALGFTVMLAWAILLLALAGLGLFYFQFRQRQRNRRLARLARMTQVKEARPTSNVYLDEKL